MESFAKQLTIYENGINATETGLAKIDFSASIFEQQMATVENLLKGRLLGICLFLAVNRFVAAFKTSPPINQRIFCQISNVHG